MSGFLRKIKYRIAKTIVKGRYDLVRGPLTFNDDGLATDHNCDFMKDRKFRKAYEEGRKTGSWKDTNVYWRAHVLCWAAMQAMQLEGDFVECGVYRGGYSKMVMEYTDFNKSGKKFYLLDTFCGLVGKYLTDREKDAGITEGGYEETFDFVTRVFKDTPAVIIRGAVPETLTQVRSEKICYLSIDMNCAVPELEAINFFWDRLVSGAAVILDDYGFKNRASQKEGMDQFARSKNIQVLTLPTGQGLILKP